jgi:ABC-type Fe3+-hydroxamate transport system substrate-binding protein
MIIGISNSSNRSERESPAWQDFFYYMSNNVFIDQLAKKVEVPDFPERIISLVPSQTELLADLGLADRVVGVTKFCVHPEGWRRTKTLVGGTKQFNFETIRSLNPDLIIGNKEENYEEGINRLSEEYSVWMSDIVTLEDSLQMIGHVGRLTQTERKAIEICDAIRESFANLPKLPAWRTLYLIWRNPWMAAASGTFIHEMMSLSGLKNCLSDQTRYPELTSESIRELRPELILLSSEPYPFKERHIAELQLACPQSKVQLVDGEMFSWYGSRLLKFPNYLQTLRKALS